MRRALTTATALVAVAAVSPTGAGAQGPGSPDASCPLPGSATQGGVDGGKRIAQTFSAGVSGELTGAQFEVHHGGTAGSYVVRIVNVNHSGLPANEVLGSTSIPDTGLPPGPPRVTLTATFMPAVPITAGTQYALLLTRPGSTQLAPGVHTSDLCPGAEWISPDQTSPFNIPDPDVDMAFTVFVLAADVAAPDTTITSGPKDKTRKKPATFEFSATDSRAVAGFECSVDGGAFTGCTSPYTVNVKKGRHTFYVRAIDSAGNADGSPATDAWKVKKRRKKRR